MNTTIQKTIGSLMLLGLGLATTVAATEPPLPEPTARRNTVDRTVQGQLADELAARSELLTRRLPPEAADRIREIEGRNPGDGIYFDVDDAGRVKLLAARALLSDGCRREESADPEFEAWVEGAMQCFLQENETLFLPGGARLDPGSVRFEQSIPGQLPGETIVAFRQYHEGVPVVPGEIKGVFMGSELQLMTGAIQDTSSLPERRPGSDDRLKRAAELETGGEVEEEPAYFDARLDRFVRVYLGATTDGGDAKRVLVDESTGEIVDVTDAEFFFTEETATTMPGNPYPDPNPIDGAYATGFTGPVTKNTRVICQDQGGPFHRCQNFNAPGECTRGLFRSSGNWKHSVRLNGADQLVLLRSPTSCTPISFDSVQPFTQSFHLTDQYTTLDELEAMQHDAYSFFTTPFHDQHLFVDHRFGVSSNDTNASYAARPTSRIRLPHPSVTATTRLETLAHEYGHHVQDEYSQGPMGVRNAKAEGWADAYALRFGIFKKFRTREWPSLSYEMSIVGRGVVGHGDRVVDGEHRIGPLPGKPVPGNQFYPDPACDGNPEGTGGQDPRQAYKCGNVMSAVYWELAWNTCRLGYGDCNENQAIVQNGPYGGVPWSLANSAYAYAITASVPETTVGEFMQLVFQRYANFVAFNFMEFTDLQRVAAVMAHHCVGPSAHCSGNYYRLPGSQLPAAFTHKELFFEAESGSPWGGPTSVYTEPGQLSGDQRVGFWAGGGRYYPVAVPQSGNYKLRFLALPYNWNVRQVDVFDWYQGRWVSSPLCSESSSWKWCDGPTMTLNAGLTYLYIAKVVSPGSVFHMDAFILERVP